VNFSFDGDCCKKKKTPVGQVMNRLSDNISKIRSLGVIVALLTLVFCSTGVHSFEECPHETVTQEVELLSTREDDGALRSTRPSGSFVRPLDSVLTRRVSTWSKRVMVTERSAINGLGTYLRL